MKHVKLLFLLLWASISFVMAQNPVVLEQELARATSPRKKVELNLLISEHYREIDPQQSVVYGKKAARMARELQDSRLLAQAYHNISIGYYWLDDLLTASNYTYKALKIREQLADSVGLATSYNVLGNLHREQKHYDKALVYFNKSLTLGQRLNQIETESIALNNLGTTYELANQPEKALQFYLKAKELNKINGDAHDHAVDELNIGNIYFVLGKKDLALQHLHRSLAISAQIKNEINKIYVCRILAQVYIKDQQYSQALSYALQSLETAKKVPSPAGIQEASLLLNKIYLARNDYKKAHDYLVLHNVYRDSLVTKQQAEAEEEVHTKYETAKKESENQRLLVEQELQKERMFLRSGIMYVTIILLVMALLLAFLFYKGRSRAKKVNNQLTEFNSLVLEKNESIKSQKEELEHLNQLKDKLFSIIAHDLRGPLISLRSLLQLMGMGTLPPEKMERFVKDLDLQQQNTLGLLDNLLMWAKLQMKGLKLQPKPLPLRLLVENTLQLLLPQAIKKEISLVNAISGDYRVHADEEIMKLVFRNLVSNAIKFCRQGDSIEILAIQTSEDQIVITVKDTGVGISLENQLKLFGPNHFKEKGTANETGSGLGLMLCKEFIQESGGEIWVDSTPGEGSQFHFSLPLGQILPQLKFGGQKRTLKAEKV